MGSRRDSDNEADEAFRRAMGAPEPGQPPGRPSIWQMTEAQLLAEITGRCDQFGISWVHIDTPHHNKQRQNLVGFPDLFLCGPDSVAFRELKREGPLRGRLRPEQTDWKYRLRAAGQNWDIWRPSDLDSGRIDQELEALGGRHRS
jgi:hypothetical protein